MKKIPFNILALKVFLFLNIYFIASSFAQTHQTDSCPVLIKAEIKDVSCKGGTDGAIDVAITGQKITTLYWSNGSSDEDIYSLPAGKYIIEVISEQCNISETFIVNEPQASLTAHIDRFKEITCPGGNDGELIVVATGGTDPYIFTLNDTFFNPAGIFNRLIAESYSLRIKDKNNCIASVTAELTEPHAYSVDLGGDRSAISGEEVIIDAGTGFAEYMWNTGETTQKISYMAAVTEPVKEEFSVEVTDKNGCSYLSNKIIVNIFPETLNEDLIHLPEEKKEIEEIENPNGNKDDELIEENNEMEEIPE